MFVALDPTRLDEPEHELRCGSLPPACDLPDLIEKPEDGCGSWPFWCVGLSLFLHVGLVALVLSMALSSPPPRTPVLISLLPTVQAPGGSEPSAPIAAVSDPVAPATTSPAVPTSVVPPSSAAEKRPKAETRAKRPDPVRVAPKEASRSVRPPAPAPVVSLTPPPVDSAPVASVESPSQAGPPSEPGSAGHGSVERGPDAVAVPSGVAAQGAGTAGPARVNFGEAGGPRFVQRVLPKYPELARRKGREGLVVLRLTIGAGGELKDVAVVEGGGHGFEDAALAAVRASSYAPAMQNGQNVECSALLPIRFALKDG